MSMPEGAMGAVLIVVDRPAVARWVDRLAAILKRRTGASVRIRVQEAGAPSVHAALDTLFNLERMVLHRGRTTDVDRIAPDALETPAATDDFLVYAIVDLTAAGAPGLPR